MKVRDFSSDLTIRSKSSDRVAPKVSIILPTYARAQTTLSTAVESVLSQSFGDFELIIVDDGSRDGTADVLSEYARVDDRIILHSYHRNSGLPALRVNQAALRSRGNYIGYQFDDDVWTEDSLRVRMSELERADQLAVVYGNSEVSFGPDEGRKSIALGGPFNFAELVRQNFIANNTVLHHRSLFDVAGMYDPHVILRRYSDYDLWLRFSQYAKFIWVDQTVSLVNANLDNSLGREIPHFYTLHRKMISIHRDRFLTPGEIENYDVVDVALFADRLTESEIENYRRNVAIPFLSGFNDYCTEDELSVAASLRGRRLNLMTVKPDFSTSVDVTINNFVNLPFQRALANTFVPEWDLPAVDLRSMDIAILYRTVGGHASAMVDRREIPTVYCMDDNMLHFHEVGAEHHLLAPGTIAHRGIVQQISESDACIGYGESIVDDLRELNGKTIELTTNIPRKFVQVRDYQRGEKLRIAILSGPGRTQILAELWPALAEFADRHTGKVEMHFWGIDPSSLGALSCETYFRPFDHNYQSYLRSLLGTSFDVVLVPLDHSTRAARSKSPIKLLEAVAAGAICIFSNAEPYSVLPDNCCLKASNTIEAWSAALEAAFSMGSEGRNERLERARSLVIEKYTTEGQFYDFMAAYDAVRLHARLKNKVIAFGFHEVALGGATLHLLQHVRIARSLGFRVMGVIPENASHLDDFKTRWNEASKDAPLITAQWPLGFVDADVRGEVVERSVIDQDRAAVALLMTGLQDHDIGLLHFATWSPTMSLLGKALGIPSVASVHQFYGGGGLSILEFVDAVHCSSLAHGTRWENAAKVPVRRIVCPAGDEYFRAFQANRQRVASHSGPLRILVSGTLQPRKNQLAVIQAIERLKRQGHDIVADFIGYTEFNPEYVSDCRKVIADCGLGGDVRLHGFVNDPLAFYDRADLLLIAAFDESMPQTIIQAMACGVPVASTNVGGVREILRHRYTGLLIGGQSPDEIASAILEWILLSTEQRLEMVDRAQRAANFLARSTYVKFELIGLYNEAFQRSRKKIEHKPDQLSHGSVASNSSLPKSVSSTAALLKKTAARDVANIKRYTRRNFKRTFAGRIVQSEDLRGIPYREYVIPFKVSHLKTVSLVVGPVAHPAVGFVGIEIVTPSQEIVVHEVLLVELSDEETPVEFSFPIPLIELEEDFRLRVFTREAETAISICEMKRRLAERGNTLPNIPLVRFVSSQARAVQN